MTGKVAIVTGGTTGIGEAVTRRFAEEGARTIVVARNRERCRDLVSSLPSGQATFIAASVTEAATAEEVVSLANKWGGPDVLVNNAGVDHTAELLDTPIDEVRGVFETNFFGAYRMLVAVGRAIADRGGGGSIINVTSRLASIGVPGMAAYGASKGALLALTKGAAVELAPLGIRVNAVAPGMTATPLFEAWVSTQADPITELRRITEAIPQKRVGTPEEVASAVIWLAADESAHVTGASIPVDGGYTAT